MVRKKQEKELQTVLQSESRRSELEAEAFAASEEQPVLLDRYLRRAIEVDVDALCDGTEVVIAGIMEHIEQAGVHSGDSACSIPPRSLSAEVQAELARQARLMALDLGVVGLMNVQFAVCDGEVYVLEVNPRASRTVPFVAKATGFPLARVAARLMAGETLADLGISEAPLPSMMSVKEAVLPFRKFPGVDIMLGPEMKSTGETMGSGATFAEAYAKALLGAGVRLPMSGRVVVRVDPDDADLVGPIVHDLKALGFTVAAGDITADALAARGLHLERVDPDHRLDGTAMVLASGRGAAAFRHAAVKCRIPCYTTIAGFEAGVLAIGHLRAGTPAPLHLREVQARH